MLARSSIGARIAFAALVATLAAALPDAATAARPRPKTPVLSGAAIDPSQVRLTWTASPGAIGYNVRVDGNPAHHMNTENGAATTVVLQNLLAGASYSFDVKAYDAAGRFSLASDAVAITLPLGDDTVPPGAPSNLRVYTAPTPSRVGLMWDHGSDDRAIAAYQVLADGAMIEELVPSIWYPGVPLWYTHARRMTPGTTVSFTVRTRDESGNVSPPSNAVVVAFPPSSDVVPPSAPEIYFYSAWPNCGFIDLAWNDSVDDVDPPLAIDYEIYEDGVFIGVWTGEVPEGGFGRHRYHVIGVDRSGNASPPSNVVVIDSGLGC
jgi:chitodextrinase